MNVTQLRYAQAVARAGTFGRAARACSVTQPALSNAIAALERTLGGRLFHRTTRGITVTAFGERLLPLIDSALRGMDAIVTEARLAVTEQPRTLRIGVSPLIGSWLIGRTFEAASGLTPPRTVVLNAANLTDLRRALTDGEVDLIVVPAVVQCPPGVQRVTLAREPVMYLTAGSAQRQAPPPPIDLREVTATPLVLVTDACGLTPFTRQIFAAAQLPLSEYPGAAHDCRIMQDWVALGLGAALLPQSKVTGAGEARPIQRDGAAVTIAYDAWWLSGSPAATDVTHVVDAVVAA